MTDITCSTPIFWENDITQCNYKWRVRHWDTTCVAHWDTHLMKSVDATELINMEWHEKIYF